MRLCKRWREWSDVGGGDASAPKHLCLWGGQGVTEWRVGAFCVLEITLPPAAVGAQALVNPAAATTITECVQWGAVRATNVGARDVERSKARDCRDQVCARQVERLPAPMFAISALSSAMGEPGEPASQPASSECSFGRTRHAYGWCERARESGACIDRPVCARLTPRKARHASRLLLSSRSWTQGLCRTSPRFPWGLLLPSIDDSERFGAGVCFFGARRVVLAL